MRSGRYIRTIIAMLMLLLHGAGEAWAADITVTKDGITIIIDGGISNGTVGLIEDDIVAISGGHSVTLTVTPASGYKIKKDLIVVEKMVNPSSRRRAPGMGTFELTGSDAWVAGETTYTFEIPADYAGAYVTATFVPASTTATPITSLDDITEMDGDYELIRDIDASGFDTSLGTFTGTLDGGLHTIYNLGVPLFNIINGGTVKNVIMEDVNITTSGDAGAICNQATGDSRIYNCGVLGTLTETKDAKGNITSISSTSSVSGSGNVGSIVGLLDGTSRVINCYSFATVSGGAMAAGIVGNNSKASTQSNLQTIVVNCMFYGDITGGTSKYPVYGGQSINNEYDTGINPYCYFRKNATFTPTGYNRSWPAEEKNLTRFEYYRSVLNSNRKLCTWWVSGANGTAPTDDDVKNVGIAKWVLDPSIAPYPILKKWDKYPSVINLDPEYRINPSTKEKESRSSANEWEGKSYGTLSVSINAGSGHKGSGSTTALQSITITDMDTLNNDFGYYKIQLPYYNEVFGNPDADPTTEWNTRYAGNYTDYVVTGWEITSVTGGTPGSFDGSSNHAWKDGFNFADRECTNKDLYSVSNRIFAQGGYYYVPKDVSAISITAHWGKAFYLANRGRSIDRVKLTIAKSYKSDMPFTPAGTIPSTFQGKTVYSDLQEAIKALDVYSSDQNKKVADQAIVLIGNHQVQNGSNKIGYSLDSKWHPHTIMSADFDFDNEPDYCLELQFRHDIDRPGIQPIRFDFLPVVELGLAVRHDNKAYAIGIFVPQGHFEITETAFMRTTQFEYDGAKDDNNRVSGKSPVIINGGEFEMFNVRYHDANRTSYFLLGGKAWIHRFAPGAHPNLKNSAKTDLCVVNAIGGEYPEFYLSGIYRPEIAAPDGQAAPHCYTNGGKFGIMAGAGYDKVKNGVTFKINHSLIGEFYGGGINGSNPIGGNIDVTIDYSRVNKYCGGPKVGNMSGKTVTTHATGTTFDVFFGGGNGGNSYYRQLQRDGDMNSSHIGTWTDNEFNWNGFNPLKVKDDDVENENKGYHAEYEFEVFNQSNGVDDKITQRGFIRWIQFGLTKTGSVSNTLTDCNITTNFYGGGNLGTVDGDVTSELTNTTVLGSVFGAGYSASIPTFQVHDKSTVHFPSITAGVITDGYIEYDNNVYEWTNDLNGMSEAARKASPTYEKDGKWYCYTWNSLENLGAVTGKVTLDIDGTTSVAGNVYGGGESSDAEGDVEVNIKGGTMAHDVYGGGALGHTNTANTTDTSANTTAVNLTGGTVRGDVYGGGLGRKDDPDPTKPDVAALVEGDVLVTVNGTKMVSGSGGGRVFGANNINGTPQGHVKVLVEKTATVDGQPIDVTAVFGGGNLAAYEPTNASDYAEVEINKTPADGRLIVGNVFGGGNQASIGNSTTVAGTKVNIIAGNVKTGVYGGCNTSGTVTGDVMVTLTGGTIGTDASTTADVFGGGYGEPTLVNGNVTMNFGTKSDDEPPVYTGNTTIYGNIYGGGALGCVNASKSGSDPMVFYTSGENKKTTTVNLYQGTIHGDAYGGGLGDAGTAAYVGGNVFVTLDGAKITGSIFGCNNINGTPKGHVKVHVKRTVNIDDEKNAQKSNSTTPLADRTTYDVLAVYGGGNKADYNPTDANIILPDKEAGDYAEKLEKLNAAFAEVLIEGCDQTSIQYVYGGGNAAAVPATEITINSAYIIDQVFGGGNGAGYMDPPTNSIPNPGADVGVIDRTAYEANPATGIYGTGIAKLKLIGGQIHEVYGGSNTKGNVRGGTSLERKDSNSCPLKVGQIYGAGQIAPMDGDVNIVLECMPEEFVDAVYGGAKNATINGNVTLVVTSGKFGRVFGGNNEGGSINGSITVFVSEDGCDPLIIGELYGGGYNAPYSIWGCNDDDEDGIWTPNTSGETPYVVQSADRHAIEVYVFSCTSIGKIFGGGKGETAKVIGNTRVWVNTWKGYINGEKQNGIGKIGQVFGGGSAADVKGNTQVDIGTALANPGEDIGVRMVSGDDYLHPESNTTTSVTAGIYGGGLSADVDGNATLNIGTKNQNMGITIAGDIYGGGYGETTHVTGDVVVNIGKRTNTALEGDPVYAYEGYANITGDVYGGSAKGKVNSHLVSSVETATEGKTTQVNLYGGTISGNLYGGGLGESTHAADVYGPVTVNVEGGKVNNVFGCNNVLGSPKSTATVNIHGMVAPIEPATYTITSVYGGGRDAAYNGTGGVRVAMTNGWVNDVFGGGLGSTATVGGPTTVEISGGSVINNVYGGGSEAPTNGDTSVTLSDNAAVGNDVYGGGSLADVTGAVTVALNGGTVAHDVYGGGALASTNTSYTSGDSPATSVTLAGTTITGNLYGGGLGRLAVEESGTPGDPGYVAPVSAVPANVDGPVTVTVSNGKAANVFGCNNQNGSPQRTAAVTISGTAAVENGSAISNVYGGGNVAAYNGTGGVSVTISGGTANNVYGGGYGPGNTAIVNGNTSVTISGGTIGNDVFGGGSEADVTGSVSVSVSGGKVINDVYGGGALANTNTANWTPGTKTVYINMDEVLTAGTSSVYGLYDYSGANPATEITESNKVTGESQKAEVGHHYYEKRVLPGDWANASTTSTGNTTTVTLTGGIIGNVYGGGLGDSTTPVYVFGDIKVNVNKPSDMTSSSPGVAFTYWSETPTISGESFAAVPMTGNVFGCNNINGTPLGDVTVGVYSTRQIDEEGNYVAGHSPNGVILSYEIQAVYGGGNQADYLPAIGKGTHVIIDGCGETSISNVYGGGSAASVPATDVVIWGSYDIGYAFGGGNGFYKIKRNGVWTHNDGADVNGLAKIVVHGGKIGEIFGGSDAKGNCRSTSSTQEQSGSCPLVITRLYGAGKEADVDGDVNVVISACTEGNSSIEYVCGGSYKAHISGNVHLTITSGYLKNVYGGNDQRGGIGGNITVDIEETEDCKPIIIQNLVGGSNKAVYPGEDKTGTPFTIDPEHPRKITVNVKSATRIDNIFGGSFLAEANANTEVNINMNRGLWSGQTGVTLPSFYGESGAVIPDNISNVVVAYPVDETLTVGTSSVVGYYVRTGEAGNYTYTPALGVAQSGTTYCKQTITGDIKAAIGTIGNVYGGGNEGEVKGNTTVNIGTSATVSIMDRDPSTHEIHADKDGSGIITKIYYTDEPVLGAHIDGDVYGGGYIKDVTGNATVNYCTQDYTSLEGCSVGGSIYGGGNKADIRGNTFVTMSGGYVHNGIFGGGYTGSVGTFERSTLAADANVYGHTSHDGCIGKPIRCTNGGKCTVVVDGGQIGPVEVATGGMIRLNNGNLDPVSQGWVWGGGYGETKDPTTATNRDTHFKTYVNETDVTIGGTAFIMEGVIGGGEFGRVLGNTLVKIKDHCQIGVGAGQYNVDGEGNPTTPKRYTDGYDYGNGVTTNQFINPLTTTVTDGNALAPCSHFTYASPHLPYDPYYKKYSSPQDFSPASTDSPSDGKTWIGVVFGGGSGYMPYEKEDGTGYDWCRSAGWVEGNTEVRISGGHILSNVYGANEYTDVNGKSKVTMTGGTIGVPRTLAQIAEAPTLCYLFGAGKGDQRSHFNNFTNVGSVEVEVSGGIIYGSVFGGSEDGHVLGNTTVTIKPNEDGNPDHNPIIGTWGTSYVDGNIFGGGRGFSGETLGAGNVNGNITVNITGGTMLGSIYGGGRMASVGVDFAGAQDPNKGQFSEDNEDEYTAVLKGTILTKGETYYTSSAGGGQFTATGAEVATGTNYFKQSKYGHVTINISGGTIGKSFSVPLPEGANHSGNVFGGSMGRLTLLNGNPNPLWTRLAQVKTSNVNITGGAIKRNVYGGSEYGTTRDDATISITAGTIEGHVYGGGYGSDEHRAEYNGTITAGTAPATKTYRFTPLQYAGLLGGNSHVTVSGGRVKGNVYGGGELASVGVIDYEIDGSGNYKTVVKHATHSEDGKETYYGFGLSWPYEFKYVKMLKDGDDYIEGGKTTVNITGTAQIDNYVFGGGKGKVAFGATDDIEEQRYIEAHLANVRETEVTIGTSGGAVGTITPTIGNSVYGGGDDGHVNENASVTIHHGTITHSVFGGGKGESTYTTTLLNPASAGNPKGSTELVHSWTAGKVYGNTSVTMNGGQVGYFIYGGGNLASVGKGNYSGGSDDYSTSGYGELPSADGEIWTETPDAGTYAYHFQNSGNSTVTVMGGAVGSASAGFDAIDGIPYGSVFGGSRGQAAKDVDLAPRYKYVPDFFVGYVNKAIVNIGGTSTSALSTNTPNIYGSVYGGGQDGHVRNSTEVKIFKGNILRQTSDELDRTGHVFGAGSGIGKYTDDGSYCSASSGSVFGTTLVEISGDPATTSIVGNVYGGGALSSVGPSMIGTANEQKAASDDHKSHSYCRVNVMGGTIIGSVYGASRGPGSTFLTSAFTGGVSTASDATADKYNPTKFATSLWTEVNILPHPTDRNKDPQISGSVYGGGEMGQVKESTEVNLTGGKVATSVYGGGKGTLGTNAIAADVGGNTTVELNKGVGESQKGCVVKKIFGCNAYNGTPKGLATVHVFATQHDGKNTILDKVGPVYVPSLAQDTEHSEGYIAYLTRLIAMAKDGEGVLDRITASVITAAESAISGKAEGSLTDEDKTNISDHAKAVIAELEKTHDYDVEVVYGGGDLADYIPTNAYSDNAALKAAARTKVIIEGCAVTSIQQVYGGGNAASSPATDVEVRSAFIIDELFGGGNGKDNYQLPSDGKWYENPGANIGYTNFMHYDKSSTDGSTEENKYAAVVNDGSDLDHPDATDKAAREANYSYGQGEAKTVVTGGHIHTVYGGSNEKGNIRKTALSQYQKSGVCALITDETYGGSKNALIDAEINVVLDCMEGSMGDFFGGSMNADIDNNVTLNITNGTFGRIFGGNNKAGTISGEITINIEEKGCVPIVIGELYGGGYLAPYSVYGYKEDKVIAKNEDGTNLVVNGNTVMQRLPYYPGDTGARTTPYRDPVINIVSATSIGDIYGGGYKAVVIGSPHINVNMKKGKILEEYAKDKPGYASLPAEEKDADGNQILPIGTIGNIFGGGNMADVIGNTFVDIGTNKGYDPDNDLVFSDNLGRNAATITGNVYGGGKMGHVGYFTKTNGKPTGIKDRNETTGEAPTGTCTVTISNGTIGPGNMTMYHLNGSGNVPNDDMPDDKGHVFGGGQGTLDIENPLPSYTASEWAALTEAEKLTALGTMAFVDSTEVNIGGTAFVQGCVFGGAENGHVLHNTGVKISGGQIGNGHILKTDVDGTITVNRGVNRPYTLEEWTAGKLLGDADWTSNSLPECAAWPYGKDISNGKLVAGEHHAPYDKFANAASEGNIGKYADGTDTEGGHRVASSGRTFYGSVFGGGSGYFPYAPGKWLDTAGQVEGNTWVVVTGGHILTSLYGGNEMTTVKGDTHVIMKGGTLGVPRTLDEIDAHPVTCYVFGGGKGEGRSFLNGKTNVQNARVDIQGGWVYGSIFGGAEDGHVLGNTHVTVSGGKIGTWGTSYVDGNIFGGGRGYDGHNPIAGDIGGNVTIGISGGEMLGSVYGGGRLGSVGIDLNQYEANGVTPNSNFGKMMDGNAHGHITVNISGGIIGNDDEFAYNPSASAIDRTTGSLRKTDFESYTFREKTADGESTTTVNEGNKVTINKLAHPKGGNVFAGGMGRLTKLNGSVNPYWDQLGLAKETSLTISAGTIKGSVFGGSEFGRVTGNTTVSITGSGATVGTEVSKDGVPQYTFGSVYGGGYGSEYVLTAADKTAGATAEPREYAGLVEGNTTVTMSAGAVKASIYGGGNLAQVSGSSQVNVGGGDIGLNKVRKSDGYVMYGGATMGNVYGAGKGSKTSVHAGQVKVNTEVNISGGNIYHNVYGGGALASVGTFDLSTDGNKATYYVPVAGMPVNWTSGTGTATVNITGGTVGINGRDNGMVNGSSRGDIEKPDPVDAYDKVAWINNSVVTIGTAGEGFDAPQPQIKGSVYGGGENGHNAGNATVNVHSGTVGIVDTADPWYSFASDEVTEKAWATRGNIYGAGCGTDMYDSDDDGEDDTNNPWSGFVRGNTLINIDGGLIAQSVYGGGSMGSVGTVTSSTEHNTKGTVNVNGIPVDTYTDFSLSWPYEFVFAPNTGRTTINITGGRVGTTGSDNGDVFGGTRGKAGDRYAMAHLANVYETYVTVDYPSDNTATPANYKNNMAQHCITGSVYGGSEDGHVQNDTHVILNNGLVGHALYGGGKGKGTYTTRLKYIIKPDGASTDDYPTEAFSFTAGKVYGNTNVTMNNGYVVRNIYGGGNMASIGKGNYAGGLDDYFPMGYGEYTPTLWTSTSAGDDADHFLNSGKTDVKVLGGTVGYINESDPSKTVKDGLPYGNVFGGARGQSVPNVNVLPPYEYTPTSYSGYVNDAKVTIGTAGQSSDDAGTGADKAPRIYGSVYGGGQDGHVRRDAYVIVNSGEIGIAYNSTNRAKVGTSGITDIKEELDNLNWLHRGNVYGSGSGIGKYQFDFDGDGKTDTNDGSIIYDGAPLLEEDYCTSAGSVTRFTQVDINGGIIHRNVYGGGSRASVGPPPVMPYDAYKKGDTTEGHGPGKQSQCTINVTGTVGTPTGYNEVYGGEVYGASRGDSEVGEKFATTVWTKVNILKGAHVMGNVFGGGDAGKVKKDTKVVVGDNP